MNLSVKFVIALLLLLAAEGKPRSVAAAWEASISLRGTVASGKTAVDLTAAVSESREPFTGRATWKADEKGFASLEVGGELAWEEAADVRGELLFKRKGLYSIALEASDVLIGTADLDVAATLRQEKTLSFYELSVGLGSVPLAACALDADVVLRENYARLGCGFDGARGDLDLEVTCREGRLDRGKAAVSEDVADWSLRQAAEFLFDGHRPVLSKGTFTAGRDVTDLWSVRVSCDHAFREGGGIEIVRLVLASSLENEVTRLSWTGELLPDEQGFLLAAWDSTFSASTTFGALTWEVVLRLDEKGLKSVAVEVAASLSG